MSDATSLKTPTDLLARMLLSAMDVPARQSYTMAVVPPEERAAAASVTNVPRSLASAFAPPFQKVGAALAPAAARIEKMRAEPIAAELLAEAFRDLMNRQAAGIAESAHARIRITGDSPV